MVTLQKVLSWVVHRTFRMRAPCSLAVGLTIQIGSRGAWEDVLIIMGQLVQSHRCQVQVQRHGAWSVGPGFVGDGL
jgi:hypothetical protein